MVKAYLRYEPEGALGVITSAPSIAYVLDGARNGNISNASAASASAAASSNSSQQERRLLVAAGSLEAVALWDAATGELVAKLDPPPSPATGARAREVTSLASLVGGGDGSGGSGGSGSSLAARPLLAVGHADGRVRLWDVAERRMDASLAGHSSAVTCLAFDDDCGGGYGEGGEEGTGAGGGNLLASGGADTDVVVWDVGAESGLCRLRGHAAPVTAVCFVVSGGGGGGSRESAALLAAAASAKNPNAAKLSSSSAFSSSQLLVASAAKDGCVRLWHLAAGGACVCTVATGSGELWALSPAPSSFSSSFAGGSRGDGAGGTLLAGAGVGGDVLLWRVGEVAVGGGSNGSGEDENAAAIAATTTTSRSLPALLPSGTLRRSAPDRATSLSWSVARGAGGGGGDAAGAATGGGGEVPVLVCASSGRVADAWRGRSAADARRHAARRAKRRRDKDAARGGGGGAAGAAEGENKNSSSSAVVEVEAADALEALPALRLKHRVRAAALCPAALASCTSAGKKKARGGSSARLALALSNNVIEFWDVSTSAAASDAANAAAPPSSERASSIDGPGHRAPVRALALAPDGRLALAASGDGSAKLWNVETMQHVRSVEPLGSAEKGEDARSGGGGGAAGEGGALSALWAPGGRHAVLGAKAGSLWLVDAATGSASRLASSAHAGPIWSLAALPDGSGFVSASADKDVKFWEWEVETTSKSPSSSSSSVSARHVRSLRLADDALCAKVSPDGRYLAVALLDSTIQVFHADSLKFALALYGHALPALAFDISSDGALLVSGGADKSVRVWGLDFGDCHRAMRGHADSVTAVAFVPGTHHAFTASKDGSVRYWDCDAWQSLLVLDGCGGGSSVGSSISGPELWCLAVSQDGALVLSGGADRAVRAWRRGDEPFFVEEENERRLESMFDADADAQAAARASSAITADGAPDASAPGDATTAARPTAEALTAADELVEAMDLADEEDRRREAAASSAAAKQKEEDEGGSSKRKRQQQQASDRSAAAPSSLSSLPPSFQPNPLLLGLSPDAFVLRALRGVRPADLEAAALSLPLADALRLLSRVRSLLLPSSSSSQGGGKGAFPASPELLVRAATLLVRVHAPALAGSRAARSALARLRGPLRAAARASRDALAENEAALRHLCRATRARGRVA